MPAILGTPRETFPGERRVAITPRQCEALRKSKIEVLIESGAGAEASSFSGAKKRSMNVVFPDP